MNGQIKSLKDFETYAEALISKYQIPGVAIGLAHNGVPVYEKGFGFRNIEKKLPVTMDTVFGIASVTKSFTCVAIMQLQEQGQLNVHDPVVKYLPEFYAGSDCTNKMTIEHFMTHTAGLPPLPSLIYAKKRSLDADPSVKDYPGLHIKEDDSQEPIDTYEQLMEYIGKLDFELLGEPGTEFSYSNDAYGLLGAIVERVSGISYESYVKQYILEPSGMKNTYFEIEEIKDYENITSLYATKKQENGETFVYEAPIWWESPAMRGAGALKSTVHDMLKYAEIFRNKGKVGNYQILTPESVEEMVKPRIQLTQGKYYGYGFMITPDFHGVTLVEHGGNLKGVASQVCIIPEKGITGMILTNLAGVPAPTIMNAALNDLEGRSITASSFTFEEVEVPAELLKDYEGIYQSMEGMELKFTANNGSLEVSAQGTSYPIKSIGSDKFVAIVRDQTEVIRFIRNDQGKVIRAAYHLRQVSKVE
ncbi:beta-lactamase family protein [Bacillus litorisediminis]|uniref:beta-lactamase family protein n=2 Tax=Bacillus litorisediminis TaxID=2922713 RepID=UPI001FABA70D|nr:beta-lactamase family protein [Bacillus litorisediminis]